MVAASDHRPSEYKRLECVDDLIRSARSNKFSTLRKLSSSDQDVFDVWDNVSQIIEYQMRRHKAVNIPGLGSFTFTTSKLDVGHNKFILIQRPVFVLSEKLVRTHRLTQSRYHVPGEIPVLQLNFTALSYELNLDRDLVEASIKEVVNALSHNIEKNRSCEFAFTTIGNLIITNGTAKMKFLPSFLEKMGQREGALGVIEDRPGTANSVLSDKTIVLPKIQPGQDIQLSSPKNSDLYILKEEEAPIDDENTVGKITPRDLKTPPKDRKKKEVITPTLTPLKKVELGEPSTPPSSAPTPRRNVKRTVVVRDPRSECGSRTPSTSSIPLQHKASRSSLLNLLTNRPIGSPSKTKPKPCQVATKNEKCDSCNASLNDFCYLCYQRDNRNVPVYFDVERNREEQDEDRLLQAYTLLQDKVALQAEQDKKIKNRKDAQAIAGFNLKVAEELKAQKDVRDGSFERSYVFKNRPVTPPHYVRQEDYADDLHQQVTERKNRDEALAQDNKKVERVEQKKLAEELKNQWEEYLSNKSQKSTQYRQALDAQVAAKKIIDQEAAEAAESRGRRYSLPHPNVVFPFQKSLRVRNHDANMMSYKSSELPAAYPDSQGPIFGMCDTDDKKRSERRKRAQALYQNQVEMAEKKRETTIIQNAKVMKEEEELLRKTKADLLDETLVRNSLNLQQRKELEKTWAVHDMHKKAKELEEKLRARSPGLLLQEQCDKYASCNQCTRKQANYGRSNVWSESRYVSGSRLMV